MGDRLATLRTVIRRTATVALALLGLVAAFLAAGWTALLISNSGTPSRAARGSGHDAEWLGHAWVDGRKTQSDVNALAAQLRDTGIRDLLVHAGPFRDDGTLDPGLRPQAGWLISSLHAALPGVRVQAWLGAHPVPEQLHLDSASTRASLQAAVGQVLDDGFDGVHLDFEPVRDGDGDLVSLLRAMHELTKQRHVILSISASHVGPLPGMAAGLALLPGQFALWSGAYLHTLAEQVDQVALMAYDTWTLTSATYGGYVRRAVAIALAEVPREVALLIGVPAYHEDNLGHHRDAETVAAAIHGIRLALGAHPPQREFGVAIYVDFAATDGDWSSYRRDWL
jgi:hypothetical protein